jgi:cellulose synthase/poly-beta-1,6-N-acetylglucosamine synthase-like glycosyltransferase
MNFPDVDIIIPCRNEQNYIENCVRSFFENNYPKNKIHVFVIDGLSTDNTPEILLQLKKEFPQLTVLVNEKQTTPFALNIGLKATNNPVKIIFGAHAIADKNFILKNIDILSKYKDVGCTGGIIENIYENKTGKIIGKAMASVFGVGNAHFRTASKTGFVDTVAFGAYKQEVFDKIGYFDEELTRNQDDEFNFRLLKNGFKIYLSPEIKAKYYVRGDFKKLFRQYYQYGYWKVYVNKKHKTVTTLRQLVPMFFVLYLIVGLMVSLLFIQIGKLYVFGLLLYFMLAFYFAFKADKNWVNTLKIAFTFFILHFSYGLGYLKGIIDFIIFNKKPASQTTKLSR